MSKKYFLLLMLLISLSCFLALKFVSAQTNIPNCQTSVSTSGQYELNANISANDSCLTINASNVELDCKGNTISYGTMGLADGIAINVSYLLVPLKNITIKNCNIIDTNVSSRGNGFGIVLSRVTDSYIFNNTIQTNGTSANHGIVLTTGCKRETIENNTINTYGTSTGNYGIYFNAETSDNKIMGNNVTGIGTTTSYALYLTTDANNNSVYNNNFTTISTIAAGNDASAHTIYIYSSNLNNITGNYIYAQGARLNYAVYIYTNAEANVIKDNNIFANCTSGATCYGIYVYRSPLTTIRNNTIGANGTGTLRGILATNAQYTDMQYNNITIYKPGASTIDGIAITLSPDISVQNNIINVTGAGTLNGVTVTSSHYSPIKNNDITISGTATIINGVTTVTSHYNDIQSNNISIRGITSINGVLLTTSYDNTIHNNSISINGTSTINGVLVTTSPLISIQNNNISINGTSSINGFSSTTSADVLIQNNNLSINGTSSLNGVLATTSPNNTIENNILNVTGNGVTNNGVYLSASNLNIVRNNSIFAKGTTPIYGVYLLYSAVSNIIENNNITTVGTTANPAVYLTTGANENIIRYNTLTTRGSTTLNYGIQIISSNNNIIESNNISTNGTTGNHGVYLLTQAENNTVRNNIISASGTLTTTGVYINSANYNKIIGNTIIVNGSNQSVPAATSNYGINIIASSYFAEVYNNTIITGGVGSNFGIYLTTNSRWGIFRGNNISARGNGTLNYGAYIYESHYNTFEDNIISTSGNVTGPNYGVYFYSSSRGNTIQNNSISTFGGATSYAFNFLFLASGGYPEDNILNGNTLLSIAGNDLNFSTASINGTWLVNQGIRNYSFAGIGGLIDIENSSAGNINFLFPINGTNTTFSNRIFITNNFVGIDEYTNELNKSAEITIYNLPTFSTELQIIRNGGVCNLTTSPPCRNLTSMQNGNVTFNVTGGGNYSINSSSEVPGLVLNLPENNFNTSSQSIDFNFTATDDVLSTLNCSIYIDSLINQTNETTQKDNLTNFLVEGIAEGNHSWYVKCFDGGYNVNVSEIRTFNVSIPTPSITKNYPGNNSYLNNLNSLQLNYTAYALDLRNMTVWLYGDGSLLNTSYNVTNGTTLNYTWTGPGLGQHNWTIIANNSIKNSTNGYFYFNLINLTINCEAGGPYKSGALVLVYGNLSNGTSGLSSQSINNSLYKEGIFNVSISLTSLSDGSFQTSFSNLADGNYTLNVSSIYQGYNKSCADNFSIGGELVATSASFVLDKIISLQELTPTNLTYNITLRLTNKGGSTTSSINLTDSDSPVGSYNLGTLTAGNSTFASYTKTYQRNSTNYNITLAIARVNGTDSLNSGEISANSSEITIIVPATTANTSITLTKNAQYLEENSTSVTYNLTIDIINSGGIDLNEISAKDSDTLLDTTVNLNRTQSYLTSRTKIINKSSESQQYNFSKANATYNSITYQSNQISILIPALENNASLSLSKTASVYNSTNLNITYNITLILINSGGRNATLVNITDSDSTESLYDLGTLTAEEKIERSYLKTYNKSSLSSNQELTIANASGIDSISNNLINASSSPLSVFIPALESNASLLLSKSASVHLTNNTYIVYNITLSLTNKGGRNATNSYIYDSNSTESSYNLGTLTAGQASTRSYLQTFNRTDYTTTQTLNIATANSTDSISGQLIEADSDEVAILIPALQNSASLVLDKIASFYNLTNETFTYNITLRLTNKGGSNATNVNITDLDYANYNFSMETLGFGETITRSYLLNFTRNSTAYYNSTAIAQAFGIDSFSNAVISANSTMINLTIPDTTAGIKLTIIKNVEYVTGTNDNITYNVSDEVVNSGDRDLTDIIFTDQDVGALSLNLNISEGNSYKLSALKTITREATNSNHEFIQATASISEHSFNSSQPLVRIPGKGGGPNDVKVYAPASVQTSTSFNTVINVTNENPDISQDFIIDYWITNNDKTFNYTSGQQTIYIMASGKNSTTATLDSPSSAGTYKFGALVSGTGVTNPATAFDSFEATSTTTPETPSTGGGGGSITGRVIPKVEHLFDVNVRILEEYLNIYAGQKIMTEITIYNLGTDEIKDAKLHYYIKDSEGKIIRSEEETIAVYIKSQLIKTLLLPEDIKPGICSFYVSVSYDSKSATSNAEFKVIEAEKPEVPAGIITKKNMLLIIFIIAVIIFLLIIIILTRRKTKETKLKMIPSEAKPRHFENIKIIGGDRFLEIKPKIINNIETTKSIAFETPVSEKNILLKIKEFINYLWNKHKKYPKNSIRGLIDKKVYSENGDYIGKVNDIILGENRIESLKIEIDRKYKFKVRGIIMDYRYVKNVGEIVIIGKRVSEHMENFVEEA